MTRPDTPEALRQALRRGLDLVDEVHTQRLRFRSLAEQLSKDRPAPRSPAEVLRDAATARDAPIELVRVARAVRDGRTTWAEVAAGGARTLPEVADLHERSRRLTERARALPVSVAEPAPVAPPAAVAEDQSGSILQPVMVDHPAHRQRRRWRWPACDE